MSSRHHFRRRHLPHWEVTGTHYFVTVRCADSLPREAVERLREIHLNLSTIAPRSAEFAAFQRQVFQALDRYLDSGLGSCPLRHTEIARLVIEEFSALSEWKVDVPHYSVMPNHWHALIAPAANSPSLSAILKRLKGRTGRRVRTIVGASGPVWQGEWFDRWIRDKSEWERVVRYIQNNPVKAGIAPNIGDHPWTR